MDAFSALDKFKTGEKGASYSQKPKRDPFEVLAKFQVSSPALRAVNEYTGMNMSLDDLKQISGLYTKDAQADYNLNIDQERMQAGKLPSAYAKKYKTDFDRILYNEDLPPASEFPKWIEKLQKEAEKKQAEQQYQNLYKKFEDEFTKEYVGAQLDDVIPAAGSGRNVREPDIETILAKLLTKPEYYDVAANFQKPKDEDVDGYDLITQMVNAGKPSNKNKFTVQDLLDAHNQRMAAGKQQQDTAQQGRIQEKQQALFDRSASGRHLTDAEIDKLSNSISDAEIDKIIAENNMLGQTRAADVIKSELDALNPTDPDYIRKRAALENEYAAAMEAPDRQAHNREQARKEVRDQIAEGARAEIRRRKQEEGHAAYMQMQQADDFDKYAAIGAETEDGKRMSVFFNSNADGDVLAMADVIHLMPENGIEKAFGARNNLQYIHMTADEAEVYYYLAGKDKANGTKKAAEYLKFLDPILNQRRTENFSKSIEAYAKRSPVGASVASVPLTFIEGQGYLHGLDAQIKGEELDPNAPQFMASRTKQTLRNTVSEEIGDDTLSFLYNTGMSILDFAAMASTTGGAGALGQAATLSIMGASAATDTMLDVMDRGGTQEQALIAGGLAGAFEAFFESFSLDRLIKMTAPGQRGAIVTNILKQAGIEASEEIGTEIANILVDTALMGDMSNYNLAVQNYMAQGMSEQDAGTRAFIDMAVQVGLAGLGGALSGGVMGGGGSMVSYGRTSNLGNQMHSKDAGNALIESGLDMPGTDAYTHAARLGEAPSNYDLGNQYILNVQAQQAEQRAALGQDLQALGVNPQATETAMKLYDRFTENNSTRTLKKLHDTVRAGIDAVALVDADLNVSRVQAKTRLNTLYSGVQAAMQSGDVRAFQIATGKYMDAVEVAQAKIQADQVKAKNKTAEVARNTENVIAEMDEAVQAQDYAEAEAVAKQASEYAASLQQAAYNGSMEEKGGVIDGGQGLLPRDADVSGELRARPESYPQPGDGSQVGSNSTEHAQMAGIEETGQGDAGSLRRGSAAVEGTSITRGLTATPEAEQSIQRYIQRVHAETGQAPDAQIINEVDAQTADTLDLIKGITGRDVFLVSGNDAYANGWVEDGNIFVRADAGAPVAFTYGHEYAHATPPISAAGMEVIGRMSGEQIQRYEAYRDSHISSPDNADIRRELVADMFGAYMETVANGEFSDKTCGLDDGAIHEFYLAFDKALQASSLEDVDKVAALSRSTGTEYSRLKPDDTGMYSKMERVIDEYKGEKISTNGLVSYLGGRGVKAEEIKWSGVEQFIEGKKSVGKDELKAFLARNSLEIKTLGRGDPAYNDEYTDYMRWAMNEAARIDVEPEHIAVWSNEDLSADIYEQEDGTWFDEVSNRDFSDRDEALVYAGEKHSKNLEYWATKADGIPNIEPEYQTYSLPGGSDYREVLFTLPHIKSSYQGPHWLEDNVFAHTRLQDFTASDGGKVLFVEEVQSDWHQKGREDGYAKAPNLTIGKYEKQSNGIDIAEVRDENDNHVGWIMPIINGGIPSFTVDCSNGSRLGTYNSEKEALEALSYSEAYRFGAVPDAPFRDTWHEYVLKRIIRMAAEGGYDYVAWTTGDMQADRYNLQKQIGSIIITKHRNQPGYYVEVYDPDERMIGDVSSRMSDEKIIEIFGKDLGRRMIDGAESATADAGGTKSAFISGEGLKMGGEGMKAFYDIGGKSSQNVPRFLSKYVKPWGATVQSIDMSGYTVPAINVTEQMRHDAMKVGQPLYSRIRFTDKDGQTYSYQPVEIKERTEREPKVKEFKIHDAAGKHIDLRTFEEVGKHGVMAFAYEHSQLRPYVKEMAQQFLYDLEGGQRGQRYQQIDLQGNELGVDGVKRHQTREISELLDSGMSYSEIENGLKRIVRGSGTENTASAKRIELMLDIALSNGHTTIDGETITPNLEYLQEKSQIAGAQPNQLFDAASMQMLQSAIQENTAEGRDRYYVDFTVDGQRKRLTGQTQDEVLQKVALAKEEANGVKQKYYADFQLGGERMHLESDDRAELESQITTMKQEHAYKNTSRSVLNAREAAVLFRDGVSVEDYYKSGNYKHEVAKHLRGNYLRNGLAVGGALGANDLATATANAEYWKNRPQAWYTLTSPIRLFEELGNWRSGDASAQALNWLEGKWLSDKYFGFVEEQGANSNLWMREQSTPIREAFDGQQSTSTLAQLLGEGIATEQDVKNAIYDSKNMIVSTQMGTFVFDGKGQLKAMSSGGELVIFDESFYKRQQQARKEIAKLIESRNPKITHEEHLQAIREAEQRAMRNKPTQKAGDIRIEHSGTTVKAIAGGQVIAEVTNGRGPNVENVQRLTGALQAFYADVLPQQNGVLVNNGYAPVNARQNYFPHIGRQSHGVQDFINTLKGEADALPASISGITQTFKPGKPFVTHLLERMGDFTEYDAIRGFNKYVQSAADLIHYTPAIQRIRQLEKTLRESSGTQNSALVNWLHNYANLLANKKSDLDRGIEGALGREAYTISDKLTKWFGAASVAGNISSALSNTISLLSSIPSLQHTQLPKAMKDTILSNMPGNQGDGFAEKIPVLARRFGRYDAITTDTVQNKAKHVGSTLLGFTFKAIDRFAVETAARAKYQELMSKGYAEADAIAETSSFITKVFAERSKGMTPTLFNTKTVRPLVQFQLEPLNQLSHMRDQARQRTGEQIDEIIRKNNGVVDGIDWAAAENKLSKFGLKGLRRAAEYLILMFLWNQFTRWLMGRDQAIDPVGMGVDAVRTGMEGGNVFESLGESALDQLPFASMFTGGRVPLMGGVENIGNALNTFADKDASAGDMLMAGMKGVSSFIPGGAQLSKSIRGADANAQGGAYTDSGKLRYPISDEDYWKVLLFGPSAAAPEGFDYQKDTLSDARTRNFKELVGKGVDPDDAYGFLREMNGKTKPDKLVSIITYDGDKDGFPDFDPDTQNMIAAMLGIKVDENKPLDEQAKKAADDYLKGKETDYKKDRISEDELEKAQADHDFWLTVLGY